MKSYEILIKRLEQLRERKRMIPIYVANPIDRPGSKKDFSLKDLPEIDKEIEETAAAINGILLIRKLNKKVK
jgi:hypothetical protein